MSLLGRLVERRVHPMNETEWLLKALGGQATATGRQVGHTDALRIAAVYACIRVISETVASVPFVTYKRIGKNREVDRNYHLYDVLHSAPNPEMTAIEVREVVTGHAVGRGNGYAEIVYDGLGRVRELWPLLSQYMEVFRRDDNGELAYLYTVPSTGEKRALTWRQVFHLRNFGGDGLSGYSTIQLFRETFGLALAQEEFGARFYDNNSRPSGILESPRPMSKTAIARLRESWDAAHKGLTNSHRVAILEGGVTWKQTSISQKDAEYVLGQKFTIAQIARIYRVPLHMIGELDKATFSNIEHQGIEFTTHTIRPWCVRWEQTSQRDLYARQPGARSHYSEHNLEGLMRGSTVDRYNAYHVSLQDGWQSINEVRERENLNPVEGGDDLRVPVNMQTLDQALKPPEPEPAPAPAGDLVVSGSDNRVNGRSLWP